MDSKNWINYRSLLIIKISVFIDFNLLNFAARNRTFLIDINRHILTSQTGMPTELQVSLFASAYALETAAVRHFQGALFLYQTIVAQQSRCNTLKAISKSYIIT